MTKDKNILIYNIYYMLAYAFRDFRFNAFEYMRGEKFDDAQNLLAEILIRSVSSQLKQGLYKTYVDKEGALSTIRGRVDMLKTWAVQQTNPYRVYCKLLVSAKSSRATFCHLSSPINRYFYILLEKVSPYRQKSDSFLADSRSMLLK